MKNKMFNLELIQIFQSHFSFNLNFVILMINILEQSMVREQKYIYVEL